MVNIISAYRLYTIIKAYTIVNSQQNAKKQNIAEQERSPINDPGSKKKLYRIFYAYCCINITDDV